MDKFNLNDAVNWANLEAEQRFVGLRNTEELKTTVLEMFGGSSKMTVDYVQGTSERFKCRLFCGAGTIEGVRDILNSFEENTYIKIKPSKSL